MTVGVVPPQPLRSGAVTDEATVRAMFDRLGADRSTAAHARIADAWATMSEHNRRLFVAGFAEALRARGDGWCRSASAPVDAPGDEAVWGLEALGALVDDDRRFPDPR
jgi:hypothetical protein